MSFSLDVKTEIMQNISNEIDPIFASSFIKAIDNEKHLIKTTNKNLIDFIIKIFIEFDISYDLKENKKEYRLKFDVTTSNTIKIDADMEIYDIGYLTGCFLLYCNITDPSKGRYHFEGYFIDEDKADTFIALLTDYHIEIKLLHRRSGTILYINQIDKILDFLSLLNSKKKMFELVDIKSSRDLLISSTRMENCYIYNEMKALSVAKRQKEDIEKVGLAKLDGTIRIIAELRLNNPNASLNDLALLLKKNTGKDFSKAGINYYFRKIKELANN